MRTLTSEAIKELLAAGNAQEAQPAVTIYAPMHTTASPPHISENQTRIKNLISRAINEVVKSHGEDHPLAGELQEWLDAYYDDLGFWERQTPGLLLCARPSDIQWFHLPVDTDEYVAVDETFHLAPMLAILNENYSYYVLLVNQHKPKLFKGNMYELHISGLELPVSLEAALNIDEDNQKSENQASAIGGSMKTGGFNGRGGAKNPQEEDRLKFFRLIDRLVCNNTKDRLPMILAGIEAEAVEYRNLSKYSHLLRASINGSHADFDMEALHRQAIAIIKQELVLPMHQEAIEEYHQLAGTNPKRTAQDIPAIESAIEQGRVDKLLAPISSQTTDTIRDTLEAVQKITLPQGDKGKLLNHLAIKVWQMSGTIVGLTPQEMPNGAAVAARLRY